MENAILTMYYGMFMANFYIAHNLNLHSVLNVDTLQKWDQYFIFMTVKL